MGFESPHVPNGSSEEDELLNRVLDSIAAPKSSPEDVAVPHPGDKNKHPQPTAEELPEVLEGKKYPHGLKPLED